MKTMRSMIALNIAILLLSGCGRSAPPAADPAKPQPSGSVSAKQQGSDTLTAQSVKPTPDLADGAEKAVRSPEPLTLAELHQKYHSLFLFNGPSSKRQIALTFDDVPDTQFTPQVLDVLKKYNVKATFFAVGNRAAAHPEIIKRIVREGHVVGNHSFSHPNLPKLTDQAFQDEVLSAERILTDIAGYAPTLFRPPYGNINEKQIQWLASQRYYLTNWNVDSLDWESLNAKQVTNNVLAHVGAGSVVLQHGAGGHGEDLSGTVQALPTIIESLHQKGIRLVTIPELFEIPKSK